MGDVVNLDFRVWLNDLAQVVLKEVVVEEFEMSLDHHVLIDLLLVDSRTLLEHRQTLSLVGKGNFFHGFHMSVLEFKGDGGVDESQRVLTLPLHDLAE